MSSQAPAASASVHARRITADSRAAAKGPGLGIQPLPTTASHDNTAQLPSTSLPDSAAAANALLQGRSTRQAVAIKPTGVLESEAAQQMTASRHANTSMLSKRAAAGAALQAAAPAVSASPIAASADSTKSSSRRSAAKQQLETVHEASENGNAQEVPQLNGYSRLAELAASDTASPRRDADADHEHSPAQQLSEAGKQAATSIASSPGTGQLQQHAVFQPRGMVQSLQHPLTLDAPHSKGSRQLQQTAPRHITDTGSASHTLPASPQPQAQPITAQSGNSPHGDAHTQHQARSAGTVRLGASAALGIQADAGALQQLQASLVQSVTATMEAAMTQMRLVQTFLYTQTYSQSYSYSSHVCIHSRTISTHVFLYLHTGVPYF